MTKFKNTLVILILFISFNVTAQEFKTYTYFSEDSLSLYMDLFLPDANLNVKTPLVIFVHGGGFALGNRTAGHSFAKHLISENIACASISYTLYMKGKSFSCDGVTSEKVKAMQIAANQLWQATAYLIGKAGEINIDTAKIFIAGSSAGAETVLHAAYWDRDEMQLYKNPLANSFKYAGLIAGSGAIMDLNLITNRNNIPTMMFHGDKDPTVPYATAAHHYCPSNSTGWLMFFGSLSIAKHLEELNGTCELTTFKDGKHGYAGEYFNKDQYHVSDFINKTLSGEKFITYNIVKTKTEKTNGWANLERYQKQNSELKNQSKKGKRVVFMGDSITDAWIGYCPKFFSENLYIDRGISGQTTPQMLARFRADVIDLNPTAVVILAGTNDIAGNTGPTTLEEITGNIISMTELAKANNIEVILASVLPAFEYGWRPEIEPAEQIFTLNKMIKKYAAENDIFYLDYFSSMTDERKGMKSEYSEDGVHPNLKGYEVMMPLVKEAIEKIQ
ncbi:MAG: alpha/beta hydrolase fold domain-containing protein [Melioribacteraceae bacterium]|nr:alpha/beta hydrolase fold domain-containing protein [Melioribacteraceae bacterium]